MVELYDLENDPDELNNLSANAEHANTIKDLSRRLMEHMQSVNDPLLQGPLRWPYYENSMSDFTRSAGG